MGEETRPEFPTFAWDVCSWTTTAQLPSWHGCGSKNGCGEYSRSDGDIVAFDFAPDDRGDEPLTEAEINLVRWVVDHEKEVHDAILEGLFENHPGIREEWLEYIPEGQVERCVPAVGSPEDFDNYIGINAIYVHQIDDGQAPYIGIELWCPWDDDHTQGILMHGTDVLEIGDAMLAITLDYATKHAQGK